MGYSEISVILLVYSGLITFFLVPFQSRKNVINQQSSPISFIESYKESLMNILFHKKAILAFILTSFTLFIIWLAYDTAESHFNAHSGISTDLKAIYSIGGVVVYTVGLILLLAFLRTLKIVKDGR